MLYVSLQISRHRLVKTVAEEMTSTGKSTKGQMTGESEVHTEVVGDLGDALQMRPPHRDPPSPPTRLRRRLLR